MAAALLLYLPMAAVLFLPLLIHPAGQWPTGFVQYDQASYMAMAREYFDGGFHPLYGNPFSHDPETPRLFFQPWTLALGLLWQATGWDPGRLYLAFGALAGLVCLRLAIALYGRVVPEAVPLRGLGLVLFAWGGGLFFLAGLAHSLAEGRVTSSGLYLYDPALGLWFLNFGRNLFYATEAFYHALSLGLLVALLDRRFGLALGLLLLLALSHPFTGAQLLLVTLAWSGWERLRRPESLPLRLPAGTLLLLLLHVGYYLLLLPALSPEHASLEARWREPVEIWIVPLAAQLLGWGPVALLAALGLRGGALASPSGRLLAWMALASFALANHELLMGAHQPLHFTRGYVWTPLLLLGLPPLLRRLERARPRRLLAAATTALFLLDNASWLAIQLLTNLQGAGYALELTPDERALMARLEEPALADHLLVIDDHVLAQLATVYTPLRPWAAHIATTPFAGERFAEIAAWRESGAEPAAWRTRPVAFVVAQDLEPLAAQPWVTPESRVERIGRFTLVLRPPPP